MKIFFFQAEDGIRDIGVTGVQTCALPISGNVLIGADGRVVLTDFGLAIIPGDPNVTRTGLVLGSPAYIAPERAKDGTAGPQADLWSLGATLFAAGEGPARTRGPSPVPAAPAPATRPPP